MVPDPTRPPTREARADPRHGARRAARYPTRVERPVAPVALALCGVLVLAFLDSAGQVRLRVSYADRSGAPTRAERAYRVRVGGIELRASVSDADVRTGRVVQLGDGSRVLRQAQ